MGRRLEPHGVLVPYISESDVAKAVPIGKLSVVTLMLLPIAFLHEAVTIRYVFGCALTGAGTLVVAH